MSGVISREECSMLNELMGVKSPPSCMNVPDHQEDPMTYRDHTTFEDDRDARLHRNSWLMPSFARRLTRNAKSHPSYWRKPALATPDECAKIQQVLQDVLKNQQEVQAYMPKACSESH